MPCGCLFDMTDDILFDMILFEMIIISESGFEMTIVSKSRKSSERLSIRDDVGLSLRYNRADFSRLRRVPAVRRLMQRKRERANCIKHRTVG